MGEADVVGVDDEDTIAGGAAEEFEGSCHERSAFSYEWLASTATHCPIRRGGGSTIDFLVKRSSSRLVRRKHVGVIRREGVGHGLSVERHANLAVRVERDHPAHALQSVAKERDGSFAGRLRSLALGDAIADVLADDELH